MKVSEYKDQLDFFKKITEEINLAEDIGTLKQLDRILNQTCVCKPKYFKLESSVSNLNYKIMGKITNLEAKIQQLSSN